MGRVAQGKRGGFTVLEMMVTLSLFTIFSLFIYSGITGTMRLSMMESIRLDMDGSANEVLQRIASATRDAVLPIKNISESKSPFHDLINNATNGFGAHAEDWEKYLFDGSNFLAFSTTVDGDGTGDQLDADMIPYLGISRPVGTGVANEVNGYAVVTGGDYNTNMELRGKINQGLSDLKVSDCSKDSVRLAQPHSLDSATFPNGTYAFIRFVPLRKDGNPVVVTESGLHFDLDGNGTIDTEEYHIGNLEIYYPPVTWTDPADNKKYTLPSETQTLIGRNMILVPASGKRTAKDSFIQPIFTLVRITEEGQVLPGEKDDYDAVRVQLTLLNFDDRDWDGATLVGGRTKYRLGWDPLVVRKYESLIHLRTLTY